MKQKVLLILVLFSVLLPLQAFAGLDEYFVGTDWLAANRDKVVVVDVRREPLYLLGHIAAAYHVERDQFLETRNGVKSLVPGSAKVAALLGSLGATPETPIVVYAEDNNPYAARLVWTLQYHGHRPAFVLNGGYEKWKQEGRATALFPTPAAAPANYQFGRDPDYLRARAESDYVFTRLENQGVVVWDTRRLAEYKGEEVRAERGGHIPGAVHLNWEDLQQEVDGVKVLKSENEIRALLGNSGITTDKEIIAHCQTGIRSSYATLVLLGLGYQRVSNYDGSWIEWANNPSLPIIDKRGELDTSVYISLDNTREGRAQEVTQ